MEKRTMLLRFLLLALLVSSPGLAAGVPARAAPLPTSGAARELRARADALRRVGEYEAALQAYQEELAASGESADLLKHIAWTQKALRRFSAAAASLQRATELDPGDREARDDLESLKRSRGLRINAWLGGTEPGTSKTAFEGQLGYGGFDRLELHAGGGWTDNIFYESAKGYADAYWFYSSDSLVKGGFTLRRYSYTGANRPTPDSNAYELVPRGDVEISHWIARRLRVGLAYQLFAPNFFYDKSTRIVNHKLSAEMELPLGGGFVAQVFGALLRDPDPARTLISGRPVPGAPGGTLCPGAGPSLCAAATSVAFRTEVLVGGALGYETDAWGASVKYIPNRDLDAGFSWSLISALDLRPLEKLSFNLQWILDQYSTSSGPLFAGNTGNVYWGTARYQLIPALAVSAGLKWVANPGPASTTAGATATRNDGTLLVNLEYLTSVF
jgi:tetratricopeptide (TPR) repeat protein